MITFHVESLAVRSEIEPLLRRHYDEIALHRDRVPLDPDWAKYRALEEQDALRVFTARDDGRLVGYSVFFLSWLMHYRQTLCAANDILYLEPEYRQGRTGLKLIRYSEEQLLKDRPDRIQWHVKTANDWSAILKRLGYGQEEVIMGRVL